ncbi:hypothetical protein PoB_003852200 [Plakobranchus ocellatus]|uniref:Uncharacterized protein n=1 Tax=Plakobranchus ocellatus TaxID=259542 RepID=A0AAV4AYM5_9GAST|nr:hypothetical protein PoB_003852200 [Plakobranchus ocellatus]
MRSNLTIPKKRKNLNIYLDNFDVDGDNHHSGGDNGDDDKGGDGGNADDDEGAGDENADRDDNRTLMMMKGGSYEDR